MVLFAVYAYGDSKVDESYSNFMYASLLYEQKQYGEALRFFENTLKCNSENDFINLKYAENLIHLKNTAKAFEILLPLSQKNTEYSGEADMLLAAICLTDKHEMTAVSFLNHALKKDHSNKNIYLTLSDLYEETGFINDAIKTNLKAIEIFPYDINFQVQLAKLYFNQKNYNKAKLYYRNAYVLDENNTKILYNLAMCMKQLNKANDAIQYLEKLLNLEPLNKKIYLELSNLYIINKQYKNSFIVSERLISIDDSDIDSFINYAFISIQSNNPDNAIKLLESKLEYFNQNAEYIYCLAKLYSLKNDYTHAENYYKQSLSISQNNIEIAYNYALMLHEMNRDFDAISLLKKHITKNSKHALSFNLLGYLLLNNSGSSNDAIQYIESALKLEPENPAFLDSLGYALFKKGNFMEALIYVEKAKELSNLDIVTKHLEEIKKAINASKK